MRLGAAAEYALQALLYIARNTTGEPVQGKPIARELELPQNFLLKILQRLAAAGVLTSRVGCAGGFLFSKPPAETTLLAVLEAIEEQSLLLGDPNAIAGMTRRGEAIFQQVCHRITIETREALRSVTLADLIRPEQESHPVREQEALA